MNYAGAYNGLMAKAKDRSTSGYVERHHVLPRSLGGADTPGNIVALYPREHFVAHILLAKMHPLRPGLSWAVVLMSARKVYGSKSSRAYASLRAIAIEERRRRQKGVPRPRAHIQAMLNSRRKWSDSQRKQVSALMRGTKASAATRQKLSLIHAGKKYSPESVVRSAKARSSLKEETILSMRSAYDAGGIMDRISRAHGVSLSLGSRIMKRKAYKWVAPTQGVRV